MTYYMFIDDERYPPDDGRDWVIARNNKEVLSSLINKGMPSFISFDNDLAEEIEGYDIAKLLVSLDMDEDSGYSFPKNFDYYVHSQNPIAKDNIIGYLENYLKFKKDNK